MSRASQHKQILQEQYPAMPEFTTAMGTLFKEFRGSPDLFLLFFNQRASCALRAWLKWLSLCERVLQGMLQPITPDKWVRQGISWFHLIAGQKNQFPSSAAFWVPPENWVLSHWICSEGFSTKTEHQETDLWWYWEKFKLDARKGKFTLRAASHISWTPQPSWLTAKPLKRRG